MKTSHAVYGILDELSNGKIEPKELLKLDSGMAIDLLQKFDINRLNNDTPNMNMVISNVDDINLEDDQDVQQIEYLYAAGISKHTIEYGVPCVTCIVWDALKEKFISFALGVISPEGEIKLPHTTISPSRYH